MDIPGSIDNFGTFLDQLNARLLDDGRKLELLSDYRYRDPNNEIWTALSGWKVDGASIPQVFWSLIGGPLEGKYRNASVIHDYYCDTKEKSWQATHLNFYYGMRAGGVGEIKAEVMYYAVYKFGPRWEPVTDTWYEQPVDDKSRKKIKSNHFVTTFPHAGENELREVEAFNRELEAKGPVPLHEIRQRADRSRIDRLPFE